MSYSSVLRSSLLASFSLIAASAMFAQAPTNTQFITGKAIRISGSSYTAPDFTNILAVTDLNKDDRPDIVATYTPPGTQPTPSYAVLLQNSDGTYTPKLTGINVQYNTAGPYTDLDTVQVADVDGDGVPDLVVVTSSPYQDDFYNNQDNYVEVGNSTFTVYHGNGDGTFRSTGSVLIGVDVSANLPRIVDLHNNGKPDLLIGTYYIENPTQTGSLTVWKNLAHDVFEAGSSFIGYYLGGLNFAVGDVNGDGYPDLVLPAIGGGTQILLNNKQEGFTTGASYPISPEYLAIGDLNHDGKPDLAIVTNQSFGPYEGLLGQTLLGKGDGTFVTGSSFQVPLIPTTSNLVGPSGPLTIEDANGDGRADVVFAAGDEGGSGSFLQIFAGDGKGGVQPPSTSSVSSSYGTTTMAPIGGKPGLIYSDYVAGISQATSDGKGNFNLPREDTGLTPLSIAQGDLNGDGISDVVVMNYGGTNPNPCQATVLAYPGTGKGYFGTAHHYYIDLLTGSVSIGDVNGDGKPDIVVAREAYSSNNCPYKADLVVLLGNGDGSFQAPVDLKVLGQVGDGQNYSTYSFLADENGDGKLDLIGDWGVALGKGNGEFQKPIPLPTFAVGNRFTLALADFNRDGFMDLAVGSTETLTTEPTNVHILLADGTGHFTVKSEGGLPNTLAGGGLAVGDMNGDGKPDLVFTSITNGGYFITVRLGNGDGTTQAPINYQLASPSTDIQPQPPLLLADLNQDGKLDLIALGPLPLTGQTATGNLTIFYGLGDGRFSATPEFYPFPGANPVTYNDATLLDLNGDHAPDIVGLTQDTLVRVLNTGNKAKVTK